VVRDLSKHRDVVRVAIVEDQPLYRQMLSGLLQAAPGVTVVASAAGFSEGARLEAGSFDVALIDIDLGDGDGFDLGQLFRAANDSVRIVVLSAVDVSYRMLSLADDEAAAWSYLSKSAALSAASLVNALTTVSAGGNVIDRAIVSRRRAVRDSPVERLTARQYEVLSLLASGLTNAAIAETLGIAARSADNHVNAIYESLGIAASARSNPRVKSARLFLEHTR
jgi:DNA-binding NarL/FixJ family response regulator